MTNWMLLKYGRLSAQHCGGSHFYIRKNRGELNFQLQLEEINGAKQQSNFSLEPLEINLCSFFFFTLSLFLPLLLPVLQLDRIICGTDYPGLSLPTGVEQSQRKSK